MRDPYHFGVLAFDLDDAMRRCEATFGLPFREPETRRMKPAFVKDTSEQAAHAEMEIRFSFSVGHRPPYVELIEATETGLFGRAQGEGLHHVGFWVDDLEAVKRDQRRAGLVTEASFNDDDGVERVWYARGAMRVESLNARLRPAYEQWLAAGVPRATASRG